MLNYDELKEKMQKEELPFWGTWVGESDYLTIKAAREAGLTAGADSIKEDWQRIFELPMPSMKELGTMEYETANFPQGSSMETDEEWERFHEIFEGKNTFPVEYVLERALQFPEAFGMLLREVGQFAEVGYYDD